MSYGDVAVLLAMSFFLNELYAFLRTQRSLNYFSISSSGMETRMSALGYILFRFMPVFLFSSFIAYYFKDNSWQTGYVYLFCVIHLLTKDFRGLFISLKLFRIAQALAYFSVICAVLLAIAPLSIWFAGECLLADFMPNLSNISNELWAAFFILLLVNFFLRTTQTRNEDIEPRISKSLRHIDQMLLDRIIIEAQKYKADPILLLSVMVYENIQRPGWARTVESLIIKVFKVEMSTGIMQVRSAKVQSDEESIKIAAEKFFANTKTGVDDYMLVRQRLQAYNPESFYSQEIEMVYGRLKYELPIYAYKSKKDLSKFY